MPPLSAHLRLYCERTNDLLTGEPLNAASNIAFFIAGFMLLRFYRRMKPLTGPLPEIVILIALVFIVGTGSFIFHTVATMGSAVFDIIPIAFFIFFYLYVFAHIVLKLNKTGAWGIFLLLAVINITYKYYVFRAMDGYVSYIPTFLFLAGLALYLLIRRRPSAWPVTFATALALLSLYCRTIDREICSAIPFGTHFLWHAINGAVMYILVRELMVEKARSL